MYFDPMYYLFALPGLLIVLIAQIGVKSAFSRYSKIINLRGMTGREAAETVLLHNGVTGVRIERVAGNLTDHYDPRANVIRLSEGVYDQATIAAVGVAAHEAGHAVQYAQEYAPIRVRAGILPVCRIGSGIAIPLIILGAALSMAGLIWLGLIAFSLTVVFQLVTLPVEFNASRRAMQAIRESGLLSPEEASGARSVLTAAAMTYVAAMLQSLLILLYYIARFSGRRK